MSREWKPGQGDVAIVSWESMSGRHGGTALALRCSEAYDGSHWRTQTFGKVSEETVKRVRPLVVIDPEDRAQVERFVKACPDDWAFRQDEETVREVVELMQAALREFANPTPPKCDAALIIHGEHYGCDQPDGHGMSHSNTDAGAIWGVAS